MTSGDLIRAILAQAAVGARPPDDFEAIERRASARRRRRQQRARLGSALVVVGVVSVATVALNRPGADRVATDREPPVADHRPPSTGPARLPGPSQSPTDAARDGVVPAVAALPYAQRVSIVRSISTEEGRWILSRPRALEAPDCVLGDAGGTYGRDFVCTADYGELLLVRDDDVIVRAYPMPGHPPQEMAVTADAVYCSRQGDGALPTSMLCRVDRRTLALHGRLFPMDTREQLMAGVDPPPAGEWVVDPPSDRVGFNELATHSDGSVTTSAFTVDARTLSVNKR